MHELSTALSLFLIAATKLAAPVTEATVYSDCARVTRTATVDVDGRAEIVLPALPLAVDTDSVRLEASGGARVDTIEIRPANRAPLPIEEARALLHELERADDAIAQAQREQAVLAGLARVTEWRPQTDEDEETADGENAGKRARAPARLAPGGWRLGMAFLARYAQGIQGRVAALEEKLGELRRKRDDLAERARELAVGPTSHALEVTAVLAGRGRTTLRLRYQVGGARWTPRYEVRLDPARERVAIELGAAVTQETGEDWEDARLVFSTAIPFAAPAPAKLAAWRIGERERFIPTSLAAREGGGTAPSAPPLLAPPPEEAHLRRVLLERVKREASDRDSVYLELIESVPGNVRSTVHGGVAPAAIVSPAIGPGQLLVYVFDQGGNPLRGVKVRTTGSGGGSAERYSDAEGAARFVGLAPGSYELRAMASRLKTVFLRGIQVGERTGGEETVIMEVESGVEEVRVVEKAPTISTSAANVKESYDLEGFAVSGPFSPFESPAGRAAEPSRQQVWLAPPAAYHRPRLGADAPAALAGGHDLWFEAPTTETVRSGAGDRRVVLAGWTWPVSVERNLYAGVADQAFLLATLASPAREVLPGGAAALFVGGDPVGTANLKLVAPGEPFTLPLGVDRALEPVRQITVDTHEEGLWWKDEVSRYTVTTEVTNPHPFPVRLRLHDQLPVSPDHTVKVALLESQPAATIDAATGQVAWPLALGAGATATVKLVYTLTRPKGHRLHQ
jgi:hypothetical protein